MSFLSGDHLMHVRCLLNSGCAIVVLNVSVVIMNLSPPPPPHPHSLISAFVIRLSESIIFKSIMSEFLYF